MGKRCAGAPFRRLPVVVETETGGEPQLNLPMRDGRPRPKLFNRGD
jgi:hypothetical protein